MLKTETAQSGIRISLARSRCEALAVSVIPRSAKLKPLTADQTILFVYTNLSVHETEWTLNLCSTIFFLLLSRETFFRLFIWLNDAVCHSNQKADLFGLTGVLSQLSLSLSLSLLNICFFYSWAFIWFHSPIQTLLAIQVSYHLLLFLVIVSNSLYCF